MKQYLRDAAILAILSGGIYLISRLTGPISFLLLTTIVLAVAFYIIHFQRNFAHGARPSGPIQARDLNRQSRRAKAISLLFVFIVFLVSVRVLYHYQRPAGKDPYFFNTQHHAIKNTGIAFPGRITLFSDSSQTQKGLWDDDNGELELRVTEGAPVLIGKQFFMPVFMKNKDGEDQLLNPQFPQCLQAGDYLEEGENKLSFLDVKPLTNWFGQFGNRYDLTILFQSTDSSVVFSPKMEVSDTIVLKNVTLARGMELKALLYAKESSTRTSTTGNLLRWLFQRNIWILRNYGSPDDRDRLHLFIVPPDFDNNTRIQVGGIAYKAGKLSGDVRMNVPLDKSFYIGLEKRQRSINVSSSGPLGWLHKKTPALTHILSFEQVAYRNISDIEDKDQKIGAYNLLYLLNNLDSLSEHGEAKLREGILFHEDLKVNRLTNLGDCYLKFRNDLPGTQLEVEVWTQPGHLVQDKETHIAKYFAIKANESNYAWIYDIWNLDAEGNSYTFPKQVIYLTLLFLAIISLLFFAPSPSLISVETPFWLILYSLMVFRLLLLWRIATFPPLQGINEHELNSTLRGFDMNLPLIGHIPIPFSVLLFLILILSIYLHRTGLFKDRISRIRSRVNVQMPFPSLNSILRHFAVLCLSFVASHLFTMEFLVRLLKIVAPIVSYFYFYHWSIRNEPNYSYDWLRTTRRQTPLFQQICKEIVQSNRFFLSFITLGYLFLTDRGFGVIFLVFLTLQAALLCLTMGPSGLRQERTRKLRIMLGYLFILVFYLLISFKNMIHYLLEYKQILFIMFFSIAALFVHYLVAAQARWKKPLLVCLIPIIATPFIPRVWSDIDKLVEENIKHVRFRASLLNNPLQDVLKESEYRSGAEQKIIETAQNQWFIHSYLNLAPIRTKGINLQPHFRKAVDYSTQTRDVVLPRYVIAEFGRIPMWLLLGMMSLPLAMYVLRFKIFSNGRPNADSLIPAIALLLLFSISIIVWLSSTNRFVFFGQDFPMISLTSRVSLFIPVLIFFIVLTRNPYAQSVTADDFSVNSRRWLLFFGITITIIGIAGRTEQINNTYFSLGLKGLAQNFQDKVNKLFIAEQDKEGKNLDDVLSNQGLRYRYISKWLTSIQNDPNGKQVTDQLSTYERSILDFITKNPSRGFDLRSPVHFIEQGGRLTVEMNTYYQFELPAYSSSKAWKGDIVSTSERLSINPRNAGLIGVESVILNRSQLGMDTSAVAIVWPKAQGNYYILRNQDYSKKDLQTYTRKDGPQVLRETDLLIYRQDANSNFKTWSLSAATRRYFAINMTINGVQRMVYPLGKSSPWIREWALLQKSIREHEDGAGLQQSAGINLDYDLTREIGNYMNRSFPASIDRKNKMRVTFSVITADGDGRIRLMSDFSWGRTILNPNDENAYEERLKMEYFDRNNEMSRTQWGNWNLLHMKSGPGSSVKPLVLSAIASQKRLNWQDLGNSGGIDTVKKYAGYSIAKSDWFSEENKGRVTGLVDYLSQSINYFHTVVYFIGTYTSDELKPYSNFTQFLPLKKSKDEYPNIQIAGTDYTLPSADGKPLGWPSSKAYNLPYQTFANEESLLGIGLKYLYGWQLGSAYSNGSLSGHNMQFTKEEENLNSDSTYFPVAWSTPEQSYFPMQECAGTDSKSNLYHGIRFPALGGGVMRITPYDMINYYARLFNYDYNFRASIDSKTTAREEADRIDPAWGGPDGFINSFLMPYTFAGMSGSFQYGTAKTLNELAPQLSMYDVYAKTGTPGSGGDDNSKRLILVIMKKGDPSPIQFRKKYFIFFSLQNSHRKNDGTDHNWFWAHYSFIVKKVIDSDTFQSYIK